MPRQFKWAAGGSIPATAADFRRAKAGDRKHKRTEIEPGAVFAAPYPDIIPSLLKHGAEEVGEHGVPER